MQIVNHNLWYARILINNTHRMRTNEWAGTFNRYFLWIFINVYRIFFEFQIGKLGRSGVIQNIFATNSQHFMRILTECRPLSKWTYVKNSWKSICTKTNWNLLESQNAQGTLHRLRLMNMMLLHDKVLLCAHSKTPWRKMLFGIIRIVWITQSFSTNAHFNWINIELLLQVCCSDPICVHHNNPVWIIFLA